YLQIIYKGRNKKIHENHYCEVKSIKTFTKKKQTYVYRFNLKNIRPVTRQRQMCHHHASLQILLKFSFLREIHINTPTNAEVKQKMFTQKLQVLYKILSHILYIYLQ